MPGCIISLEMGCSALLNYKFGDGLIIGPQGPHWCRNDCTGSRYVSGGNVSGPVDT